MAAGAYRQWMAHEIETIYHLQKTYAPWRGTDPCLDPEFMASWLNVAQDLDSQDALSSENLEAWWKSTPEYITEWPKWEESQKPPDKPENPNFVGIQGQLRLDDAGYCDDVTRILPIGLHVGDLFSKFTRDPAHAERIIVQARDAGYTFIHFWMNLGTLGDYWSGRECGPGYNPDFWDKLSQLGDLLDSYGMKGGYNLGDYELWPGQDHVSFFTELGHQLARREFKTACYVFGGNEAWQTGADNKHEIEVALQAFQQVCPHVIVTTTAPPDEHEDSIAEWCGGNFFAIHGYRGAEDHDRIRHIFSVQWEGHPPSKFGIQDEPTGPGDKVSVKPSHCYEGRDVDANHMVALAVQSLNSNQGFNYFCSDGVKSDGDITRWPGFYEVARVAKWMPIDIMAWPEAIHFGSSQGDRVFEPTAEDTLRFDHRIRGNEFFGVFYGDEGNLRARCKRACFMTFIGFDGVKQSEIQYDLGSEAKLNFVRSQGGNPGYTAQFVIGRLR